MLAVPQHRGLAVLALVALIAAACSSDGGETTSPTTSAPSATEATTAPTVASTTTTTVVLPPPVPIEWQSCGGGFDCATVTAPVDYASPAGPTLDLALIRRPAGNPDERIGTLLMNPGGPGASGVRRVRRGFTLSPEVAARFDIVGFDPRGVGDSTPVQCGTSVAAFRAHDLAPDDPRESAALEAAARAVADECAATEGPRLGHLGTREVVHDLEVIRRSIGEPEVSFVGLSYGTLLGLLWAEAYPGSLRALVLDGVVDPAAAGDVAAAAQVAAIDLTLDAMHAACAADPACPEGGLLPAYDELARRLDAGEIGAPGVGPTQLAYAAFSATYGDERWPLLWHAVADGLSGDLAGVAEMARWFTRLVDYAPFALVTCLDAPHPVGFAAWQEAAERAVATSPRFGRVAANELLPCAFWPKATYEPHPVTAPDGPPVLVIGSTGDAATPIDQARHVARDLESGTLLTVDIAGHVALGDSACATERGHPVPGRPDPPRSRRPLLGADPVGRFASSRARHVGSEPTARSTREIRQMEFNLAQIHEAVAAAVPDRECIVWRDRRLTYAQVSERTRRLANHLLSRGLGVREERAELDGHESGQAHLACYLHNGNEYVEAMLGAYKARVAPFNVNYRYVAEELRYLLHDAGAEAIVFHSAFAERLAEVLPDLPRLTVLLQVDDGSGADLLPGADWYEEALAAASAERPAVELEP